MRLFDLWKWAVKVLLKYFDYCWLAKNKVIIHEEKLKSFSEKLAFVAEHLGSSSDYAFIKSADYVPVDRIDVDILVFDRFEYYVLRLIHSGFHILKFDRHSITLACGPVQVDVHRYVSATCLRLTPSRDLKVMRLHDINVLFPRASILVYLADILDKKMLYGAQILNILFALSMIKGGEFEDFVKRYHSVLATLPRRLSLRDRLSLSVKVIDLAKYTPFTVELEKGIELVKSLTYVIKP